MTAYKTPYMVIPNYLPSSEDAGAGIMRDENGDFPVVAEIFGEDAEQTAAYLVQAANAYPKLVELLRETHDLLESGAIAQESARMDRIRAKLEKKISEALALCDPQPEAK